MPKRISCMPTTRRPYRLSTRAFTCAVIVMATNLHVDHNGRIASSNVARAQVNEPRANATRSVSEIGQSQPLQFSDTGTQKSFDAALVQRGDYVAKAADCAGCHTAPRNGIPYAGGLGLVSPFGTIVSTNITPDVQYGIGRYTLEDFSRAVRQGVARGGKRLYPAMPYPAYALMTDDDLHALYAFLMSRVPAAASAPPPSNVPFPFNQRWALGIWQYAFVPKHRFDPRPDKDAVWNRGAYLVRSLGHCGSCHTPRGMAYQERGQDETSTHFLTGAVNDHWFAPNLTNDPGSGIGRMDAADIAAFLATGHAAGVAAYGSMVAQIENSTQYLSRDDQDAIARYLKSLPVRNPSGAYAPRSVSVQSRENGNRVTDQDSTGRAVYESFCARCHRSDGTGIRQVFPSLVANPSVTTQDTTSLIRLLIEGGESPATLTGPPRQRMPGFAGMLTDTQIAQVLTYIRSAWGNASQPITGNDVASLSSDLHK